MNPAWWSLIGIVIIAISYFSGEYVEKRIDHRHISSEVTVLVMMLLWVALLIGIYLGNNVL